MNELCLEMLPAAEGDSLLLRYGDADAPHYVLIDGGRRSTYKHLRERLLELPVNSDGKRFFELLIVTHIDADHIEGIICLLQDDELGCEFGDIWFNDWLHLEPLVDDDVPDLGAAQGEFLGALLEDRGLPWNRSFGGQAVVLPGAPDTLPVTTLADGLRLTLVSPSVDCLIKLREEWSDTIEAAGFVPGNRDEALQQFADKAWSRLPAHLGDEDRRSTLDHSEANGSSIAVIAEFGDVRLLLSGDAWPQVLRPALDRWRAQQDGAPDRVRLDAFKLPHHGSKKNMTPQLMDVIDCERYLVSTSGSRFHHPDVDAVRIILDRHRGSGLPKLLFNYESDDNDFYAGRDDCETFYKDDAILTLRTGS